MIVIKTVINEEYGGIRITTRGENVGQHTEEEAKAATAIALAISAAQHQLAVDNPDIFGAGIVLKPFKIVERVTPKREDEDSGS